MPRRQLLPVDQHPLDQLGERQRDEREIDALHPQRRQRAERADDRRDDARGGQRNPERPVQPVDEQRRGVGADAHQRSVRERELSGVAQQQVQADRDDHVDQHEVQDVLHVAVGAERQQQQRHEQDRREPPVDRGSHGVRPGGPLCGRTALADG